MFQLAEVLVSREMLTGMLERIGRLRLAPGKPTSKAPVFMTVMGPSGAIRLPQGSDLGRNRRFWAVTLGRDVVTSLEWVT